MSVVVAVLITVLVTLGVAVGAALFIRYRSVQKAVRYAVTLRNNDGAFIALCVKKRCDTWTFEDVRIAPMNPGGPYVPAAPGPLHVPTRNILYYQEITEVANATQ